MTRPRFTLKTLLYLMVVAAAFFAGIAWHPRYPPAIEMGDGVLKMPDGTMQAPDLLAGDEPATTVITYAFKKRYTSNIMGTALAISPKWDRGAGNPPISASKAVQLAAKMKDSLVKDDEHCKWVLASLELHPPYSESGCGPQNIRRVSGWVGTFHRPMRWASSS